MNPLSQSLIRLAAPAVSALKQAFADPERAQQQVLQRILADNRSSAFGRRHDFARLQNAEDFAAAVPIRRYEDFRADIERTAAGEQGLLTAAPVRLFEETGGSTAGAKLIPYTDALLDAFRRSLHAWLGNLAAQRPQAFSGSLYFIVSPAARSRSETDGGIPIGSGSDLGYLGNEAAALLQPQTLYQPELAQQQSADEWRIRTAALLAQHENLSLISAWSPTLLLQISDCLYREQDTVLAQIADPDRRRRLARALSGSQPDWTAVWPQLDTVSCWDSHTAAAPAGRLRGYFPHAVIQGKGLLATEGIATLPFSGSLLPALTGHYCEFADDAGNILPPHRLQHGRRYRLILTTQGGLYRYDTQDWLLAAPSPYPQTPALHFVGRGNLYSDLCGEKLNEAFVAQAVQQAVGNLSDGMFLQGIAAAVPYYILIVPTAAVLPEDTAVRLDEALCANPQYRYARRIGQLGTVRLHRLPDPAACAARLSPSRLMGMQKLPLLLSVAEQPPEAV